MGAGDGYSPPATLTELFENTLLPISLTYGLTVFEFWEMTLKEIILFIKSIQEKEKIKKRDMYLQASLNANFIGFVINGKQIPPIYDVFPESFADFAQAEREEQEMKAMMLYKEQMIDFANAVNKRNKQKGR